jgi:cytidine deaminase
VENASYGLTVCAERNAIFGAVAHEGPEFRIRELAVVALGLEFPPCGACRQVIAEFAASPETRVWFLQGGVWTSLSVADLLPAAFKF